MNLAFFQQATQGDTGTKCADVVLTPASGFTPLTVNMATTQTGGHIFYRLSTTGAVPQHDGDSAIGATVRIGANSGSVNTGSGSKILKALCYQSGFLDSNISTGEYEPNA